MSVVAKKDGDAEPKERPVKKKQEEEANSGWTEPTTEVVKPPEQLDLTEKELAAEHTRILSAKDPGAPHNIARYSFQLQTFKFDAAVEQMATHFEMEGNLYHFEDQEGMRIIAAKEAREEAEKRAAEAESMGVGDTGDGAADIHRNQFNFSERACQTDNPPLRDREVATQPPPSVVFANAANQCEIFDCYTEDIQRQKIAKDRAAEAAKAVKAKKEDKEEEEPEDDTTASSKDLDMVHSAAMDLSLRVMERMINQNTYDEIAQDYAFWEDASDSFKEGEVRAQNKLTSG